MDSVFKMVSGFFSGVLTLLLAVVPVAILWQVLTGTTVFGMDIIGNLTDIVTQLGDGGFVGLIVLVFIASFFMKK